MASEWPVVRIEEIAEKIAMGPFGSNIKVETFVDTGVPIISGAHLRETRLKDGKFNFVTEEHAERLKNSNVYRGDVVFTHAGNIGQVAYIPPSSKYERYVISQRQFYLRCNLSKAIPAFIAYFFKSHEGQYKLLANASQTGVPSIARPSSYLKTIELTLPPIEEQRAIAHILGTLDDKIELNRRQNETLEAMARALFKAWFVDFEPVRAKMDGRWQRGQSLPGLPAHLYYLFPDRLVESELGLIPEGWEITTLSNYSELNPESWNKRTMPEKIQYIDLSGVKWGRIENVVTYEGKTAPSRARRILKPLDTIVGTVRPGNGSYTLVAEEGLTGSTGFAVLRPLKQEYSEIVYLASTSDQNIKSLADLADGAAYPAVRPAAVLGTAVPKVSDEVSSEFSDFTAPLFSAVAENERKSIDLALLRDTLLPRLISGKLRVADA